ncbi:MAG TPA: glycosyltransferase family 9 protein [Gemmatimonadaceae bacterium]|nr:glycosyltransferase family 9 protein [Gemmatimonadaceae bacterium]
MLRRLQSIEFAVRSAFQIALVRVLGGPRRVEVPDWRARPYRVLFIRDDGIGDLIVTMEVLRAITESSPTITLDLLCSPQNAAFARSLPFVSDVVVHKRSSLLKGIPTFRELRRRKYDVVIDGRVAIGNVNTLTTALMLSTGARWRIGVSGRRNDRVYSVPVDPGTPPHWVDYLAALAAPFGVGPNDRDWRARLTITEEARDGAERTWEGIGSGRPRVLVNISVGNSERFWNHERYAPVLARLRGRLPNATILVAAMPAEQGVAEQLARPVGGGAIQLSLDAVMASVATADLVITPDTAITHIASGFQTPTLALMRKDTAPWAPYRCPGAVVYGDIKRRLEPGLPEARVVAALDTLLDDLVPRRGW